MGNINKNQHHTLYHHGIMVHFQHQIHIINKNQLFKIIIQFQIIQ